MRITRDYVKAYLEQYGVREKAYKDKLEQLNILQEKLNSFERHDSEVKTFNIESKQDKLIPLITDLENELKNDKLKLDEMFEERNKVLQNVSTKYLFVLWEKYLNCNTYEELAEEYNVSKSCIQERINRGINELFTILRKKEEEKQEEWYYSLERGRATA